VSTVAASDQRAVIMATGLGAGNATYYVTGLTPANTFTLNCRVSAGTPTLSNRNLIVIPMP
jgi:hypothetical protein